LQDEIEATNSETPSEMITRVNVEIFLESTLYKWFMFVHGIST